VLPPSKTRRREARVVGMFPQLGAPVGFLFSGGIFSAADQTRTSAVLLFGWRLPFSRARCVPWPLRGLTITETRSFAKR